MGAEIVSVVRRGGRGREMWVGVEVQRLRRKKMWGRPSREQGSSRATDPSSLRSYDAAREQNSRANLHSHDAMSDEVLLARHYLSNLSTDLFKGQL